MESLFYHVVVVDVLEQPLCSVVIKMVMDLYEVPDSVVVVVVLVDVVVVVALFVVVGVVSATSVLWETRSLSLKSPYHLLNSFSLFGASCGLRADLGGMFQDALKALVGIGNLFVDVEICFESALP